MLLLFYRTKEGEARLFLSDVGTKKVRSLVHYSFLPFFLAPHKKEAKKLSGSTYVFGVRSRSYVSLAVVSQINVPSRHDRASKLTLFVRSNS